MNAIDLSHQAFFHSDDGEWFVGNDGARGPWSEGGCHAGPPTGMIARALELAVPDKQLTRLSVDLIRAIPMAGFRIETELLHEGRTVATARAILLDEKARACATANSLHLAETEMADLPSISVAAPNFDEATPGQFPISAGVAHRLPKFGNAVEVAYPPGETGEPGPTTLWMRTPPLLEGEVPSPFQRLCPLADCGNAIGRNAEPDEVSFVNPDLTIVAHRMPRSDWLALRAQSNWHSNGLGMAEATLFDTAGAIGTALQTLVLRPASRKAGPRMPTS